MKIFELIKNKLTLQMLPSQKISLRVVVWILLTGIVAIVLLYSTSFSLKSKSEDSQQNLPNQVSKKQSVEKLAKSITVRIFYQKDEINKGGSGVLIWKKKEQNQYKYIVITNHHVVSDRDLNYQLETPDGKIHETKVISENVTDLVADDLALVEFNSENNYNIINPKVNNNIKKGEIVFASGFPFKDDLIQSKELNFTTGNLTMFLEKPLIGGYQIGYTNTLHNGMSGGPLLNEKGELIGINGMGKYPVIGDPYVYKDGSTVSEKQWEEMSNLSWAIPVKYVLDLYYKTFP
jgi:S1-C subfamily serine protease